MRLLVMVKVGMVVALLVVSVGVMVISASWVCAMCGVENSLVFAYWNYFHVKIAMVICLCEIQ